MGSTSLTMKLILLSLCLALASAKPGRDYKHTWGANGTVPKSFINLGAINIQGVGSMNVISQSPGNIDKLDNGFRLHGGGQAYFTQGGGDMGGDPYVYWQTELYNKVFSYDIDVSAVGCKCNAAMYWVNMPGYDGNGNPDPAEWGIYYCDANFVNGNWCPEYDTFEGNSATMNVAIHTCDYVPPNDYSSCDRGGCGTNACEGIGGQYGWGSGTIDTQRTYRISHAQIMDGDYLAVSQHTLEQEGRTASFSACNNPDSMKWMGYDMKDIVGVFSLWDMGCDESWLDGCTGCGGCCNLAGSSVTFSNFALTSAKDSHLKEVRDLYHKYNPEE